MTRRYKILIADDDRDDVFFLKEILDASGFETLVVYEGVRAIEIAHKQKLDLILMDLLLPVGSGYAVLKSLRSDPETAKIPVIVVTGFKKPDLESELKAAGAQGVIWKPPDSDRLLNEISTLLSP